ncbi:MAG: hypothetical protein U0K80_08590 [Methanobrevibacter sp.]|nr:hypothetical protein [Methanobrevibacter sp.]
MKSEKKSYFSCGKIITLTKGTPITNLCNKLSEIPCKLINKEVKKLHAERIIGFKKTKHGLDVYLNHNMKEKIRIVIAKRLDEYYSF